MIKLKPRYKIYLGALVPLIAIGIFATISSDMFFNKSDVEVKVSNFPDGTNISYEILADGNIIDKGEEVLSNDRLLNLPVPNISKEKNSSLAYKLQMKAPTQEQEISSAETLNMLLNLDLNNGGMSLSGSGLDSFSDIIVKKGNDKAARSDNITSDWAGLFSADSINSKDKENNYKQIELAFQNAGIAGDFSKLGSGKVEVLFGDHNGSTLAKVQARYSASLIRMTEELSAVMTAQTAAIGMFFDANIQLDTQRKHQELMARAHKDYHPSDQMCRIGTFIRSVAHSESKAETNKHALNKILMNQYLSTPNNSAGHGSQINSVSELDVYVKYFCDPRDNDGATSVLCAFGTSAPDVDDLDHLNKDIDYTRTLESPLTLDIDFLDGALVGTAAHDLEGDEADIVALAKNLYFPNIFEKPDYYHLREDLRPHYNSRSFAAKMNVAHNSFLNIVGMKSRAPVGKPNVTTTTTPAPATLGTGVLKAEAETFPPFGTLQSPKTTTRTMPTTILAEDSGWAYMKAMLREFGITPIDMNNDGDTTDPIDKTVEEQIDDILGERPSYYAQMEVLTKKIYQHPNFYTNLYDKPANVDRIGASIDAISLMNQRDRFESLLRREMLTSLLVEEGLAKHVEDINSTIYKEIQKPQH